MIKATIIGGTGYVAGELIRLLLKHSYVEISAVFSRSNKNKFIHYVHPNLRKTKLIRFEEMNISKIFDSDIIFLCTPMKASLDIVGKISDQGIRIIDFSPAFRLKEKNKYKEYYGIEHPFPDLLKKFIYGIPELKEEIKNAEYVSNPGCMAISAILALFPIVKAGLIKGNVIIDSKMGSSGSGREKKTYLIHPDYANSIRAYKPVKHRHEAEIQQEIGEVDSEIKISMSAHSVNIVRGILSTIHCFLEKEIQIKDLWKIYRNFYSNKPFIRIVREEKGIYKYPDPKNLIGSNFCDLSFEIDHSKNKLVLLSALDNLIKGAAGNAVQCMNLMFNLKEEEGLDQIPIRPL